MPKIYDCFSFYNELDLLDLRLHELYDVVDYFVLSEATLTHSGKQKPLYYNNNRHLFDEFSSKILHIIVQDMPITPDEIQAAISPQDRVWLDTGYQLGDNWVRERFQRNAIMRGLTSCYPDDIIIIEDADEMIRADVIADFENTIVDGSNAIGQTLHTYYLNWRCSNMEWWGSKVLRYKYVTNPSEHRFHTVAEKFYPDCGWHFGYLGGAEKIKSKLHAYAHQEFYVPDVLNNLDVRLQNKQDALGRQYQYEVVEIDESYPKYVRENQDRFSHLMYKGE
jgi:beta-1,4-mannosyl-glycoprotein beta-1,4-N-acetylglucosaminyltransferase